MPPGWRWAHLPRPRLPVPACVGGVGSSGPLRAPEPQRCRKAIPPGKARGRNWSFLKVLCWALRVDAPSHSKQRPLAAVPLRRYTCTRMLLEGPALSRPTPCLLLGAAWAHACPRLEKHRPGGWLAHPGPALGPAPGPVSGTQRVLRQWALCFGGPTPHHGSLRPFGWWSPTGFPAPCPAARQDPSLIYRHLPAVSSRRLPTPRHSESRPQPTPASGPTPGLGGGVRFPHIQGKNTRTSSRIYKPRLVFCPDV